jgi:hypothetical protein
MTLEDKMKNIPNMVPVATVSQPMEAMPIQVKLGSFGIEAQLTDNLTVAANPLLSNAIGGIRIFVAAADAVRAAEILTEHRRAEAEEQAELARTCPKCGNKNGVIVKRPVLVGILAAVTLGAFCLLYPWPRYECHECRHKWR